MAADPVTAIANAVDSLLRVTVSILDKMPDYEQRKKESFFDLKRRYENEKRKGDDERDLSFLLNMKQELIDFYEIFYKELEGANIKIK